MINQPKTDRPSLLVLFNHTLTTRQEEDACSSLGVDKIVPAPDSVKQCWINIPPGLEELSGHLQPVMNWLESAASPGDYVLIQGDYGATYLTVRKSIHLWLIPVYSTTFRHSEERHCGNGQVEKTERFAHVRFRRYEP